ncbi:MAG TPA: nuclear transport factor 2 family protein [Candidatus Xenobia bacterium]|jgi:hypothetical protein
MTNSTATQAFLQQFYHAITELLNGNSKPFASLWATEGRVCLMISSGERVVGHQEVVEYLREMAAALGSNPFRTKVTPSEPSWTEVGDLGYGDLIEQVSTEGSAEVNLLNRATIICRRVDAHWKVIHYHNDFINPMMLAFSHMVRHQATRAGKG